MTEHPAYRIEWDYFSGHPDETVCRIVEFPGWEDNGRLCHLQPLVQPSEPVHFDTHFELLEHDAPDYPNNTAGWPLMSRRMLDVLRSVGDFPHHVIPVTLVQDTIEVEVRYDERGRPKPEYSKTDYVAVHLTSYADVFDEERSSFEPHPMFPEFAFGVDKYVFRTPPEGLPPLFRIKKCFVPLFVSAKARAALEAAGIRGPIYKGLDEY